MTVRISELQTAVKLCARLSDLEKTAAGLARDDGRASEAGGPGGILVQGLFPGDWQIQVIPLFRVAAIREICRDEIKRQKAEVIAELKALGIEP